MNLHRAAPEPDWADLEPSARNAWQRLADHSRGVLTPGNAISLAGLAVVGCGIWLLFEHVAIVGIVLVILGRACDMVDGYVAHATGTKSPFGEAIDATCDKVAILAALLAFGFAGVIWWPALGAVAAQNAVNSLVSIIAARRGRPLHPSAAGKQATTWQWIGLVGAVPASVIPGLAWIAYGCLLVGLGLGVVASWRYARALQRLVLQSH